MIYKDNSFSALVRLGLSPNQAKVYLALASCGTASAKKIWEVSGISREEVYRKIGELQKLGFVESRLSKPKLFTSIPIRDIVHILLHRKAEEISNLQNESEQLIEVVEKKLDSKDSKIKYETIIVPENHAHIEKARQELLKLKRTLDCVLSWDKCIGWFSSHNQIFEKLLIKNIHIRWVIEKNHNSNFIEEINKFPNSHLFEVKYTLNRPESCLGIYDNKVLLLDTSAFSGFIKTPMLWSNNPSLVVLAQSYFDMMWNKSEKIQN